MKGCRCKKKGGNRCEYNKKSNYCGPGCECQGCLNFPFQQFEIESVSDLDTENSSSSVQSGSEDEADESDYGLETVVITVYI